MNLKQYVSYIGIGTAFAWSAWFVVLITIDPSTAGWPAFVFFYLSLFVSVTGLLTVAQTMLRVSRFPKRAVEEVIKTSLRQGVILTFLVIGALILASMSLLTWWSALLLIMLIGIAEFSFLSKTPKNHNESE